MAKEKAAGNGGDTNLLDDFEWENGDGSDFFGIKTEETPQEQQERVIRKVKDTSTSEAEKVKTKKKEEEDDESEPGSESEPESKHTWFDDEASESTGEESESDSPKAKDTPDTGNKGPAKDEVVKEEPKGKSEDAPSGEDDVAFYSTLAKEFKDKKIFSDDRFKDDEEIDEEKFFELHDAEIEERAGEIFDEFYEKVAADEDAKAFILFKKNGGDTAKFFQAYKQGTGLPETLDITKAADQKKILSFYYLNVEKLDPEDLEEKLEFITEKGKGEYYAKKYYEQIVEDQKKIRTNVLKAQEDFKSDAIEKAKKNKESLQKILNEGKGVEGVIFNDKDKKVLIDLVTKPAIKIGTNRYITQMQAVLGEVMKDPAKFLTLAKWLNEGMKFENQEKATVTKVTNGIKKRLSETRLNKGLINTGSNKSEKSLIDAFPD